MQVYFMRHGQTNYNQQGLCNDDPNKDVHLTSLGKQQAQIVAEKLKNIVLDKIIVSELPRTRQTADIVNQYHHADIETCRMINDIRSGFDSLPVTDFLQAIAHDPMHAQVNNSESLWQHKQRILAFIEWLKQRQENTLLVVAHEETLRVIVAYFNQLDDEDMLKLHFDNCTYYTFEV